MKTLFTWVKSHKVITILIVVLAYPVFWYLSAIYSRVLFDIKKEIAKPKVEAIHARKLDMDTILGKNLPPIPDATENNRTVLGVDANNNGIRDDVELYLHKKYATSTKIRAAQLQYAMALQLSLSDVASSDEMIAIAQEEGRASGCLARLIGELPLTLNSKLEIQRSLDDDTRNFVLNNKLRQEKVFQNSNLISTGYSSSFGKTNDCDFNTNEISN